MRQVLIQVARHHGDDAHRIAQSHRATDVSRIDCRGPEGDAELIIAHISNARLEGLMADLDGLDALRIVFDRRDVIPLRPPSDEAADQVIDVQPRSPIEIFLGGLQSIGSWTGFLAYAALSGVVVWIGLATNTIFLLTAAMLIAPFAGPAMTLALGTARGDAELLWRSAARYGASLLVAAAVALLLTLLLGPEVPTPLMIDRSQTSSVALLLPLAAGIAAGINLSQPDSSSLVSGAATGVLVAASLAPPAGVLGMSLAMGRFDLMTTGIFLLLLQLAGINLAGALTFRLFGLTPRGVRYNRGRRSRVLVSGALTGAAVAALLTWQFWSAPELQHATIAQRMLAQVYRAVEEVPSAELVEANVRFTRAQTPAPPGPPALLCEVYVRPAGDAAAPDEHIRQAVTARVLDRLTTHSEDITPLVTVTVLSAPPTTPPP